MRRGVRADRSRTRAGVPRTSSAGHPLRHPTLAFPARTPRRVGPLGPHARRECGRRGGAKRRRLEPRTAQLGNCLLACLTWPDLANRTWLTRAARYEDSGALRRCRDLRLCPSYRPFGASFRWFRWRVIGWPIGTHNRFWRSAIMITLCAHLSVAGTRTIRIIERGEAQGLPPVGWLLTTVPDIHATAILHASEANPRRG
jgi:hypothetical protein